MTRYYVCGDGWTIREIEPSTGRSEEHTSELQSPLIISYAVLTGLDKFCGTVSFRFEFYKEGNRIAGAGHHGLVAGNLSGKRTSGGPLCDPFRTVRDH